MLAFEGDDGKTDGLYVIHPDGTRFLRIADGGSREWSPDGARIAFERTDGEVNSVFVMAVDGSEEREVFQEKRLSHPAPLVTRWDTAALPCLHKDGRGPYDLYIVNADGSGSTHLTPTTDRAENAPVWSPNGTMIAFRATTQFTVDTADYQVFLIRPDGTHEERLTTDQSGYSLAWQSAG